MIVGNPQHIPYPFQYQLDVQYAVGRIYFDTNEKYAHYAQSVIAAETGKIHLPHEIGLFGVTNPDDPATHLSSDNLIKPIEQHLKTGHKNWHINTHLKDQATKSNLTRLMSIDIRANLFEIFYFVTNISESFITL